MGVMENFQKSVGVIVDKICDEYCKWPKVFEDEGKDWDVLFEEKCESCPLCELR